MNRRNFLAAAAASLAGLVLLRRTPAAAPVRRKDVSVRPVVPCRCPGPCLRCDLRRMAKLMDSSGIPPARPSFVPLYVYDRLIEVHGQAAVAHSSIVPLAEWCTV
jgi:hypothetical protein